MSNQNTLLFDPFHSVVDPEFWQIVEKKKLHEFKLDSSFQKVVGSFTAGTQYENFGSKIRINRDSFEYENYAEDCFSYHVPGEIMITNTIEDFKNLDLQNILTSQGEKIFKMIKSGDWINKPNHLSFFYCISFCDLKKHKFFYWFGFPAIYSFFGDQNIGKKIEYNSKIELKPFLNLEDSTNNKNKNEIEKYKSFRKGFDDFRMKKKGKKNAFFLIFENKENKTYQFHELNQFSAIEKLESENKDKYSIHLGFIDPSSRKVGGWSLKNFLIASSITFKRNKFSVFGIREIPGKLDLSHSIHFEVTIPTFSPMEKPMITGWELKKGKKIPKKTNIRNLMDPIKLAESSVTLNLQLMKWRMLPQLNTEKLSKLKCLLIGSGTLGCYVSRCLLGWGIFNITFVDRSTVSYSNPVRQPLFEFDDCKNGGKPKAQCAADHIKKIYPKVNVKAFEIDIPMPGHGTKSDDEKKVLKNIDLLTKLIEENDAIFLLTDTRESRWLPTVIATEKKKIVINSALGFDTYLVMRHGVLENENENENEKKEEEKEKEKVNKKKNKRLGCYFCNDVVAPTNSMKDRTIDQQCTVTRAGVSAIASALSVEMLVSLLHHPKGKLAKAETMDNYYDSNSSPLGIVPHQIRGSVISYQNQLLVGEAYPQCVACSECVINKYKKEGYKFLREVFLNSSTLEKLTGLKELQESTKNLLESIETVHLDEGDEDEDGFEFI